MSHDRVGTYVCLKFDNSDKLLDLCSLSFPRNKMMKPEDLHLTMYYAENQPFFDVGRGLVGKYIKLIDPCFDLFGENKDVLVVSFKNDLISDEHLRIKNRYGLTHSYPIFRPHITIIKNIRITKEGSNCL